MGSGGLERGVVAKVQSLLTTGNYLGQIISAMIKLGSVV